MALKIRWSPRAVTNLEDICSYIEQDSESQAATFAKKVVDIIKSIPQFPEAGRIVPEYGNSKIREKIYKKYRIVYRIKDGHIEIVAICHGAKLLDDVI